MKKKMEKLKPDISKIQALCRALPSLAMLLFRSSEHAARHATLAAAAAEQLALDADTSALEAWEEANREKLVSVKAAESALAMIQCALAFNAAFSERAAIAIFDAANAEKIAANAAGDDALACAKAAADVVAVLAKQAEEEAEEARLEKEFAVQRAQLRAIGLVQACFLGAVARRKMNAQLRNAQAMQRRWRWVRAREALLRQRRSLCLAQAFFRGFNLRRVMFQKRNAALKVADFLESLVVHSQFEAWIAEMSGASSDDFLSSPLLASSSSPVPLAPCAHAPPPPPPPSLAAACTKGDSSLVKQILSRSEPRFARIAQHSSADLVAVRDQVSGNTFLHAAAASGDLKTIRVLARAGARVDVVDAQGNTPLHALCGLGGSNDRQQSLLIEMAKKQDKADAAAAAAAGAGSSDGAAGGAAGNQTEKTQTTKEWLLSCVNSTGETVLDVLDAAISEGGGADGDALAASMKALVSAGAASADGGDPLAVLLAEQEAAAQMEVDKQVRLFLRRRFAYLRLVQ
jgi:hypothetical protein